MGQPSRLKACYPLSGGKPGELKHLSTRRRRKQVSDSPSSGERPGNSPNPRGSGLAGVVGPRYRTECREWKVLESTSIERDRRVHEAT